MKLTRVYCPQALTPNGTISLQGQAHLHLAKVLRKQTGQSICLFDGLGTSIEAQIIAIDKKTTHLRLADTSQQHPLEAPYIHLGQVIAKGDKMDFVIQKATELGVHKICPLWSRRCDVRLDASRLQKRLSHWQNVAIAACEQSKRNWLPEIMSPMEFSVFCQHAVQSNKFILHPTKIASQASCQLSDDIALLVGPEGGFSQDEIELALAQDFRGMRLGKHVLRTETAALAAISAIQYKYGNWQF